jgi:hypothetical protein
LLLSSSFFLLFFLVVTFATGFLRVTQTTIFAIFNMTGTALEGNVFEWVAQSAATTVTNGHITVDFNHGVLVDQLEGVAPVFAQCVLAQIYKFWIDITKRKN